MRVDKYGRGGRRREGGLVRGETSTGVVVASEGVVDGVQAYVYE